jgi:hypothetical protein
MGNMLPLSIIPDTDKPSSLGAILFHILPDSYISGVQRVILQIMETHQEMAQKMPVFEDKRRLKIPTFAGLDVFQSHIRAACAHIKGLKNELDMTKLRIMTPPVAKPPIVMTASPDIISCNNYGEGRIWFAPKVTDYTCDKRFVSTELIPELFPNFVNHYNEIEITELTSAPLLTRAMATHISYTPMINTARPNRESNAISVMKHPSSRSHIARTSVTRLEKDVNDFYDDSESTTLPFIKCLPLDVSALRMIDFQSAFSEASQLLEKLNAIKQRDLQFVGAGLQDLLSFTNGSHPYFTNNFRAVGHRLMQIGSSESFLVSST